MCPKNTLLPLLLLPVGLFATERAQFAADPVPNVIIFIADDMGLGDSSAYQDLTGNPDNEQIDTPELERLAHMGTRFTDAHSNGATCSPARISLLSGTYSFRSPLKTRAVRDNDHTHGIMLPGRRTTLAHMLQRSGYGTYGYGKWHLGLHSDVGEDRNGDGVIDKPGSGAVYEGPIESGFDTYTGTPGNFSYGGAMIQDKHYMRFASPDPRDYTLVPINHESAQPWVRQGPGSPTDPDYAYYEANGGWIWNDAFRKKWWDHVTEVDASGAITVNGPTNRAMMVQENDIIVGLMLNYLEQTDDPRNPGHKLIDNTIFIFTSDNGADIRSEAAVGALPQRSDGVITNLAGFKGSRWEGGTRVPFIAAWPEPAGGRRAGIPAGATSPALFGLNDLYATLAEAIGYELQAEEAVDSESLLKLWTSGVLDAVNLVRPGADERLILKR